MFRAFAKNSFFTGKKMEKLTGTQKHFIEISIAVIGIVLAFFLAYSIQTQIAKSSIVTGYESFVFRYNEVCNDPDDFKEFDEYITTSDENSIQRVCDSISNPAKIKTTFSWMCPNGNNNGFEIARNSMEVLCRDYNEYSKNTEGYRTATLVSVLGFIILFILLSRRKQI